MAFTATAVSKILLKIYSFDVPVGWTQQRPSTRVSILDVVG
jgi:hypothetical protein